MGNVVDISRFPSKDLGRELIVDLARYRENLVDERQIRKKYRLADEVWEKLGDDDELIRKVEEESVRRIRDGSALREKSQKLVVAAPDVLSGILLDDTASPKHRIDSAKVLNDFAANGPGQGAPASDRFIIQINLGSDVLKFDKSIEINPNDIDPNDTGSAPQGPWPVIAAKKPTESGGGQPL